MALTDQAVSHTGSDPLWETIRLRRLDAKNNGGKVHEPTNVLEWARRYRRPEGNPFDLSRFEPLRAIYEDDWPRLVIMKPAQRGVSEYALCLACYALEYGAKRWVSDGQKAGLNVGYIFPVRGDLIDFSKERIEGLKDETAHLASMFGNNEFDALGFKQVGKSNLILRGGQAVTGLKSFPADLLILDEFDELNRKAVALVRRRMNASLVRREVAISTPTFPGKGIHEAYLASDQRVYESECPVCHTWVSFDFFRDVRCLDPITSEDTPYDAGRDQVGWKSWTQEKISISIVQLHCPSCDAVIDNEARCRPGRWVAQRPEVTRVHGYHIPWWPFPMVDLMEYAISATSTDPEEVSELHRSDLGLVYGSAGGSVTEAMLAQLTVKTAGLPDGLPPGPWYDTTMGVDIGAKLHYKVSSRNAHDDEIYTRAMGSVDGWEGLDGLMFRYQVRMCVVDNEPELHDSKAFCQRWPGRAMRGDEQKNTNALKDRLYNVKKDPGDFVQINRQSAMDAVLARIAGGRENMPPELARDPEVIAHMTAPTRVKVVDESGQQHYQWVHTMPDHLFHAWVFDLIARETLPAVEDFTPAVGGNRPLLAAYRSVAAAGQSAPAPDPRASAATLSQQYASERPLF